MSRWLVSHFAPFAGARSNSSEIVAKALKPKFQNILFTESLPVSFNKSWGKLESYLNSHDIRGVLALGQADGRKNICLERLAINWMDANIPDNDGARPVDQKITPIGESLWTELPVRQWVNNNVQISYSAGTYVCNYLYYRTLEWSKRTARPALFIHLPLLESQSEAQFTGLPKIEEQTAVTELTRILEQLP